MPETSKVRARDRRVLGPRGLATRAAVLDAVARHLESTPWHLASVPALTSDAGLKTGVFYQYFPDLPAAVRELAGSCGPVPEHVRRVADLLAWEDSHLGSVDSDA